MKNKILLLFILLLLLVSCSEKTTTLRTFNVGLGYIQATNNKDGEPKSLYGPSNDAILLKKSISEYAKHYPNINYKEAQILITRPTKKESKTVYLDEKFPIFNFPADIESFDIDRFKNDRNYKSYIVRKKLTVSYKMKFLKTLDYLLSQTKKDDLLILSLSGHGTLLTQENGDKLPAYIFGRHVINIDDTKKPASVTIQTEYILYNDLFEFIHYRTKGNVLIIIDTCLSGSAVACEDSVHNFYINQKKPNANKYDNIWVISGSEAEKNTYDYPFPYNNDKAYNGLLTYSICKALGFNSNTVKFDTKFTPTVLTASELYKKADAIMRTLKTKDSALSIPKFSGTPLDLILFN